MNVTKKTTSVCPTCFEDIPAAVTISPSGVWMQKTCPEHGTTKAMVERDPIFYMLCDLLNSPTIYEALLVPVTNRCNTTCKYCFCDLQGDDPSCDEVRKICANVTEGYMPIILTGGEPTLRDDLPELIESIPGDVYILSNGLRMADDLCYFSRLWRTKLTAPDGVFRVGLSIHPDNPENLRRQEEVIEEVAGMGCKLDSVLFTIDRLAQLETVLAFIRKHQGKFLTARIHAATDLWSTGRTIGKIYVSEMYQYLFDRAAIESHQFEILKNLNNKTVFFNVAYDGQHIMLCSWQNRDNIDLQQLACGPYLMGDDGKIRHLMHGYVMNERRRA